MQIRKEYLNASLCKSVVFLQHSETFDVSHVFLSLTIAELSTLKQVHFLAHSVELDNLCIKFLTHDVHFNHLSFDLLGSKSSVKFEYSFKMHYYFIACCTLIAQTVGPMLSRIT